MEGPFCTDVRMSGRNRSIVLLTDFGLVDWFVGVMHGVIAGIAPGVGVVDLSHEVRRGDVRDGAFFLEAAVPYFPEGTIFCCVVDPGVGTHRRAVIVEADGRFFVAPDNGLLSYVLPVAEAGALTAFAVEHPDWMLASPSSTFHGRDVFAPAAAHLAAGSDIRTAGPELKPADLVRLERLQPTFADEHVHGNVLHVDRFGNLISNIRGDILRDRYPDRPSAHWHLRIRNLLLNGLATTYGDRAPGEFLFYDGSAGYIEVAENLGNAAERLGADAGSKVELFFTQA